MHLLCRIPVLAAVALSTAYSVYAFTQHRAAWCLCRSRLAISRAVQLFHAHLARTNSGESSRQSHSPEAATVASGGASTYAWTSETTSSFVGVSGLTETASSSRVSCPVAFVDCEAFDANVHAVGSFFLRHDKQVRLATKDVRCAELLERAAAQMDKLAQSCKDDDIASPGKSLVSGLLTSTAAETFMWAQRGTFSSLLLGEAITDAASAMCYVEAMTLNDPSKVRCMVVVNAIRQLELLWDAAKAWVTDSGYTRLGFDNAAESLRFELMLHMDVLDLTASNGSFHCGQELHAHQSHDDFIQLFSAVEEFNARIAKEKLPVEIEFVVRGLWTGENGQLSRVDVAPVELSNATHFIPARWFLRYPLLQWYKRYVLKILFRRHLAVLEWLEYEEGVPVRDLLISGGSSASLVGSVRDSLLTEVCVGSGLLCGHRLDRYVDSLFRPALYFALRVTRVAPRGVFVCGGLGPGLRGATAVHPPRLRPAPGPNDDDVATGAAVIGGAAPLAAGDPIVYRPECGGVLAELVDFFLLVTEEGKVAATMRTYRGEGWNVWAAQPAPVKYLNPVSSRP